MLRKTFLLLLLWCPLLDAGTDRVVWLQQKESVCVGEDGVLQFEDLVVGQPELSLSGLRMPAEMSAEGALNREQIEVWLAQQGIDNVRLSGAARTRICSLAMQPAETPYKTAKRALQETLSKRDEGHSVRDRSPSPAQLLLPVGASFDVAAVRINALSQRASVELRVIAAGEVFRTLVYPFELVTEQGAARALRDISVGETISAALLGGDDESIHEYVGAVATVPITRGDVVGMPNTRPTLAVEKDMAVNVLVQQGSVTLNFTANALQAGQIGQRVRLYSHSLDVEFNAVVSGMGKAYVPL